MKLKLNNIHKTIYSHKRKLNKSSYFDKCFLRGKKKNLNFKTIKNSLYDNRSVNIIIDADSKEKNKNFTILEIGNYQNIPFGIFSHINKLSSAWDLKDRWTWLSEVNDIFWSDLEISSNYLNVIYRAFGGSDEDSAVIRGNHKILNSNPISYFEVKILNSGREGFIGIGLGHINSELDRLPGWEKYSIGYHGDDGHFFDCSGTGINYGPTFSKGDIVGVCWNIIEKTLFFTKNGTGLSVVRPDYSWSELPYMVPVLGLRSEGESVMANFGEKFFEFDLEFYFNNFKKHYFFKNFLIRKISFIQKIKTKKINFNKKENIQKNFQQIIIDSALQHRAKPISNHFTGASIKKAYLENLEYIVASIYLTIGTNFLKKFFHLIKTPINFGLFSYFRSFKKQIPLLKCILKYWTIFQFKNNYIKSFIKYLNKFKKKKIEIKEYFGELTYDKIYSSPSINMSPIF